MHFRYQNTGFSRIEIMRKPAIGNNRWGVSPYYDVLLQIPKKGFSEILLCFITRRLWTSLPIFFQKKKAITMHFRYQNAGFSRTEIMRKPAIGNICFLGNSESDLPLFNKQRTRANNRVVSMLYLNVKCSVKLSHGIVANKNTQVFSHDK